MTALMIAFAGKVDNFLDQEGRRWTPEYACSLFEVVSLKIPFQCCTI
jgi:hypothetical protein